MTIRFHEGDLPAGIDFGAAVAIDTETMGLHPHRDRLCVVQLSRGDGSAEVVRIARDQQRAPNLEALLADLKSGAKDEVDTVERGDHGSERIIYTALRDAEGTYCGVLETVVPLTDQR